MRWVLFFLDELKFFHFVKLRWECFFQITQVAWSTTTCYYCQKRWRWRQEVVGGWWGCIFSNDLLSEQTYSHLIWIVSYLMETSWLQNCGFFDNVLLTLVMETQLLMSQPREIVLKNASLCELENSYRTLSEFCWWRHELIVSVWRNVFFMWDFYPLYWKDVWIFQIFKTKKRAKTLIYF